MTFSRFTVFLTDSCPLRPSFKLLISLLFILINSGIRAQNATNYAFTANSGSYVSLTGATPVTVANTADDGRFNGIPIGFNFTYGSTITYTHIHVSTNGWITLGTSAGANTISTALTGTLNDFTSPPSSLPVIAPLWDNNALSSTTGISYLTSGSSPNRVTTVQYSNVKCTFNAAVANIEFQVKLYESSNKIEFVYHTLGGSYTADAFAGISIGIGTSASAYLSLNGSGTSPTASSAVSTNNITSLPAEGQTYTFTPPPITIVAGDWNSGTTWAGGSVPVAGATVYLFHAVTVTTPFTNTGTVNINSGASLAVSDVLTNNGTLNVTGSFQINSGGSITGTAPIYGSASTLIYNGVTKTVGTEWTGNSTTQGLGIPRTVTLQNSAVLTMPSTDRGLASSLNILSGSSLILGSADLYLAGTWTRAAGTTFTPNSRTVVFNGSIPQTIRINGGGTESFSGFTLNNSNGVALSSSPNLTHAVIDGILTFTSGKFTIGSAANANSLTINSTVSGSSSANSFKGSSNSILTVGGTGALGPLFLDPATPGTTNNLQTLTINRAGTVTMGNDLQVSGILTLGSSSTLDMSANVLGGALTSVTGTGGLKTQNTSGTPISAGKTWTGNVYFNSSSAQTIIDGNYNNLDGSGGNRTLNSSGTIGIAGTFTAGAGAYTVTGSTIDFNGATAQSIPAFTFNNLTVSNGTKTTAGVVNVNGAFTFSSSVVTTTSTNLIILNDNATTSGASFTSYVNGPLRKIGDDAFIFPVGKSGAGFMSIGISAPSSPSDAFTAEYIRAPAISLGTITAPGLKQISACDYWNLNRDVGTSSVDITLSWNGFSNCNLVAYVTDLSTLTIAHFNGTSWDTHGKNSSTGSVSSGTITRSGVSVFSPFVLGSTSSSTNPLQIKLTSISAHREVDGIRVTWTNLDEINIDHYVVERSGIVGQFIKVGEIKATSNFSTATDYAWLDRSSAAGNLFYRVKAVELSGKSVYSSTVTVDDRLDLSGSLYPNPLTGSKITFYSGNLSKGQYQLQVFDAVGRNIHQENFQHHGGSVTKEIDLPLKMPPGIYSLRIAGKEINLMKAFMQK